MSTEIKKEIALEIAHVRESLANHCSSNWGIYMQRTELKFLQSRPTRAPAHALTKKVDERIVRPGIQSFAEEPWSTFSKSEMAGPFRTRPSASKREPWHGQSQVLTRLD